MQVTTLAEDQRRMLEMLTEVLQRLDGLASGSSELPITRSPKLPNLKITDIKRNTEFTFGDSPPINVEDVYLFIENTGEETAVDHLPYLKIANEDGTILIDTTEKVNESGMVGEIPPGGSVCWRVFDMLATHSGEVIDTITFSTFHLLLRTPKNIII